MLYLQSNSTCRQILSRFSRQNSCEFEKQCKTPVSVLKSISKDRQAGYTQIRLCQPVCLYLEITTITLTGVLHITCNPTT